MALMHLKVGVPNRGAHRLAWQIGNAEDPEARIEEIARAMRSGVAMIDRLLMGEVVPEGAMASAIARVTDGDVLPMDWLIETGQGWFDAPPARERHAVAA